MRFTEHVHERLIRVSDSVSYAQIELVLRGEARNGVGSNLLVTLNLHELQHVNTAQDLQSNMQTLPECLVLYYRLEYKSSLVAVLLWELLAQRLYLIQEQLPMVLGR